MKNMNIQKKKSFSWVLLALVFVSFGKVSFGGDFGLPAGVKAWPWEKASLLWNQPMSSAGVTPSLVRDGLPPGKDARTVSFTRPGVTTPSVIPQGAPTSRWGAGLARLRALGSGAGALTPRAAARLAIPALGLGAAGLGSAAAVGLTGKAVADAAANYNSPESIALRAELGKLRDLGIFPQEGWYDGDKAAQHYQQ